MDSFQLWWESGVRNPNNPSTLELNVLPTPTPTQALSTKNLFQNQNQK